MELKTIVGGAGCVASLALIWGLVTFEVVRPKTITVREAVSYMDLDAVEAWKAKRPRHRIVSIQPVGDGSRVKIVYAYEADAKYR